MLTFTDQSRAKVYSFGVCHHVILGVLWCGNAYRCLQAKRDKIVMDSEWVRGSQATKPTLDFRLSKGLRTSGLKTQDSGRMSQLELGT